MNKMCARCKTDFETPYVTKKYCTWCVAIHIKELAAKIKKHKRPMKEQTTPEEVKERMAKAMEARAEYIAEFFHRTGILLSW